MTRDLTRRRPEDEAPSISLMADFKEEAVAGQWYPELQLCKAAGGHAVEHLFPRTHTQPATNRSEAPRCSSHPDVRGLENLHRTVCWERVLWVLRTNTGRWDGGPLGLWRLRLTLRHCLQASASSRPPGTEQFLALPLVTFRMRLIPDLISEESV